MTSRHKNDERAKEDEDDDMDDYSDEEKAALDRIVAGASKARAAVYKEIFDTNREYAPDAQLPILGLNYVRMYPVSHCDRDILIDPDDDPPWRDYRAL